jgi:hypothetical protein
MKDDAMALGPLDNFLSRCEGVEKKANGDYNALCPVHDDHEPSLEVGWYGDGGKGTVRFVCRSRGCDKNAILAALGLDWQDLYPGTGGGYPARGRLFEIRDAGGRLYGQHHRRGNGEGKAVWWTDHKSSGLKVDEFPFHRSERAREWGDGDVVLIVEGEVAAEAADRALGSLGVAVLGTLGTSHTPRREFFELLSGRTVVLWPDNDDPGRWHMGQIAQRAHEPASEVLWFEWGEAPEKGDVVDHPATRSGDQGAIDQLRIDLLGAPRWDGVTPSPPPKGRVTTVTPIRFSDMDPPEPRAYTVAQLVPRGHITNLFGDGGSAKSILALSMGTATAGGADEWMGREIETCPALYVDFELDADEQRRRAYQLARGIYLEKPPRDLLYVSGLGRPAGDVLAGSLQVCEGYGVGLAIVDSMGIALEGDAERARDVIRFNQEYLDPFREAGVTLLIIDHQGKTQAGERYQNRRTFGSVYKENLARSVLQVEPTKGGDGLLIAKIRQTKHNFGPKAKPFGVRCAFSEESITVDEHELDASDLAEERTVNADDRVLLAVKNGPCYPADIAETTGMALGTVKNTLTRLRKVDGLLEYTGEVHPQSRAKEVRLSANGRAVMGVTDIHRDGDTVTPDAEEAEVF